MTNKHKMKRAGFKDSVLYSTRGEKLEYIKSLDEDIGLAFRKYVDITNERLNKLITIHSLLRDAGVGCLGKFSLYIKKLGIYKHKNSFYCQISSMVPYRENSIMDFNKFKKMEQIIKAFEDFKKEKKCENL
jgi:hypothetical protein